MALECQPDSTITAGDLVTYVNTLAAKDIWHYMYYADEDVTNSRIIGMNSETMEMCSEMACSRVSSHPGSVDRAGYTDKMYARTTEDNNGYRLEVYDAVKGTYMRDIPLNNPPRSSGGFNKYRGLQAISTKNNAYVNVIDVDTDTVVITVGSDGGTPDGNDGGNATGHTVWLDPNHFALLDRNHNQIEVYKINEDYPPYTTTLTDTIATATGCHSLRSVESGHLLMDRVFYAAIEGSVGGTVVPQMIRYLFDSSTGTLVETGPAIELGGVDTGGIHHFGIGNGFLMVPVFDTVGTNNKVYQIDYNTWALTGKSYDVGAKCGHADYSVSQDVWVIVNHNDNYVSLIDMSDDSVTDITISTEVSGSGFIQSHANHLSDDGTKYYLFEFVNGIFTEIDIVNKVIGRTTVTGGNPVQSYS